MAIAQFSGLASGIDSASLIDALIEAREVRNDLRRSEISHLESENEALEEINTKLLELYDLVDVFRTAQGGGISKRATSNDATVATAKAGSNAVASSVSVDVTSIANSATGSLFSSQPWNSYSDAFSTAASGNLKIAVGQGSDEVTITVAVTQNVTTLEDVRNAINNNPNANGRVAAQIINTGTNSNPNYELVLTTLQQGEDKGLLTVDDSAFSDVSPSTFSQATNAVFTINGINGTIERSSNVISDVLPGISLQLFSAGTADISITSDESGTADSMSAIIDAYNDIVEYVNDNDVITRVEEDEEVDNVYGTLAKTRTDNDFLISFRLNVLNASSGSGTSVKSLADMGISTNRDGTLSLDEDKFKEAVSNDPTGAQEVLRSFADAAGGVSGSIYQYTRFNGFIDVSQKANNNEIENLNKAIAQLDRSNDKYREALEKQFARLETVVGDLQSQQSALSGILAGLG